MSILGDIHNPQDRIIADLKRELDEARTTITELQLQAALHGLDLRIVPERIIPAVVEPAHIAVRKVRR